MSDEKYNSDAKDFKGGYDYISGSESADEKQIPSDDKAGEVLKGDVLVEKVQEYFFGDEDLAKTFEQYIFNKSAIVNLKSDEYDLRYTEVFDEYKALFERKMENFIVDSLGSTVQKFYEALKAQMDRG